MLAPSLPRNYNKHLRAAYPDCRIRWSNRQECWLLERRANYGRVDIDPAKYPKDAIDTFIQRRDGMYTAGRYHPNGLPPVELLVKILRANDTARMDIAGKTPEEQAENYCNMLEEQEAERVRLANKNASFVESGVGNELYDQLAWAEGRRVSVPSNASGVNK